MIQRCEKSQSPSKECSGLVNTSLFNSMHPSNFEQTVGWRGTARFSGNSVRITPIGLKSIDFDRVVPPFDFECSHECSHDSSLVCNLQLGHLKSFSRSFMFFRSVWCAWASARIWFLRKKTIELFENYSLREAAFTLNSVFLFVLQPTDF